MPELPEVETIRSDLDRTLSGYKIIDVSCNTPKMVKPSVAKLFEAIKGLEISGFKRRAKLIIVELEKDQFLLIHLKMTGRLLIRDVEDEADQWTRVVISLEKGNIRKELRFADQRKFGFLRLVTRQELEDILKDFGPEPLHDLNLKTFQKILSSKRQEIKKVLMDQALISGIGNIYANEALFLAKIHPGTPANRLNQENANKLFQAIETVLKRGLKYRGASDNSYLDAFGIKGKYQEHFLVYGRQGNPCINCGKNIERYSLGDRGTFYCPSCQVSRLHP